jgi:predicted small secreted protein
MNKKLIPLMVVLISMVFCSCNTPIGFFDTVTKTAEDGSFASGLPLIETNIPSETAVPTSTPSPTITLTQTCTPTITLTPTLRPTRTEISPVEWELVPYMEITVDEEWRGVNIKTRLLVDGSLRDQIESIKFKDGLLAEVAARTLWLVWYSQNKNTPWQIAPAGKIDEFMELWTWAQATGSYDFWRQVQIDNIWVNDLNDGNGYVETPHSFWPMYDGPTPYGVLGINKLTFVLLNNPDVNNISKFIGSNFNDGDLMIYLMGDYNPEKYSYRVKIAGILAYRINIVSQWLIQNRGTGYGKTLAGGTRKIPSLIIYGTEFNTVFE